MPKYNLRVIGDVHGLYSKYLDLIKKSEYSVQLGDFGFNYDCLKNIDPVKHKIIGGNHDNYDKLVKIPHYTGNWSYFKHKNLSIFTIRGGYSLDKKMRIPFVSWWPNEELNSNESIKVLENYCKHKPDIVLSHEAPTEIVDLLYNKYWISSSFHSYTSKLLSFCLKHCKPQLWVFGHYHRKFWTKLENSSTIYCGLGQLDILDIDAYISRYQKTGG